VKEIGKTMLTEWALTGYQTRLQNIIRKRTMLGIPLKQLNHCFVIFITCLHGPNTRKDDDFDDDDWSYTVKLAWVC
jgi:hypothetical protein